jgi:hypothetical protein
LDASVNINNGNTASSNMVDMAGSSTLAGANSITTTPDTDMDQIGEFWLLDNSIEDQDVQEKYIQNLVNMAATFDYQHPLADIGSACLLMIYEADDTLLNSAPNNNTTIISTPANNNLFFTANQNELGHEPMGLTPHFLSTVVHKLDKAVPQAILDSHKPFTV